jgi:hypothetical protein
MTGPAPTVSKTVDEFNHAPEDYQTALLKIVRSHAVNELHGT